MKAVLVTGGAGFLGSHLCDLLIEKGSRVVCVDNLYTGSKKNISHLEGHKNFKFLEHDIVEPIKLSGIKIDEIYNLACPASPVHYQAEPIQTIKACTIGVMNVLELAKKHDARILQASTSEIYGDPLEHPQRETYRGNVSSTGPRACYDEGKRVAETLFFDFHREHGVKIGVARIFNTYGPRMQENDGRVVSNFIVQALRNHQITIYGTGDQTRSFCYVDDLVSGLYKLMQSNFTGPVNLGNPQEITIRELADMIIELTESKSTVIHKPLPIDDPIRRNPNILVAKKKLAWGPTVNVEVGLTKTIEYFKTL